MVVKGHLARGSLRKNINLHYRLVRRVRRNSNERVEIFGCSVSGGAAAHDIDGTKEAGRFSSAEELGDAAVLATKPRERQVSSATAAPQLQFSTNAVSSNALTFVAITPCRLWIHAARRMNLTGSLLFLDRPYPPPEQ